VTTGETKLHLPEFTNEPDVDFCKPENREKTEERLE
jgi:hypothetical protein